MNESQLILIGLLASILTFAIKTIATYTTWQPGRVVMNVILFCISAGLAIVWAGGTFPPFPPFTADIGQFVGAFWQWLNDIMALVTPILGTATLIYNIFYSKVVMPASAKLSSANAKQLK